MSEKLSPQVISRRKALPILGLVGAFGFASAMLASDADAQEAAPAPAPPAPTEKAAPPEKKTRNRDTKE